jgi:GNAT superfamily N-acetyltransferase
MGRIIGDGGWYFHIADMATLPGHQRKGLGKVILKELLARIKAQAPVGEGNEPYITLLADGPGRKLYEGFGFEQTGPKTMGMALPRGWWKDDARSTGS